VAEDGAPVPAPTAPGAAPAQVLRPSEAPKFAAEVDTLWAGGGPKKPRGGPGGPMASGRGRLKDVEPAISGLFDVNDCSLGFAVLLFCSVKHDKDITKLR